MGTINRSRRVTKQQLNLHIPPRVLYSAENFHAHAGVGPLIEACEALVPQEQFRLLFLSGTPRSGKTHLAVKLSDIFGQAGRYPRLVSGEEMPDFVARVETGRAADEILIIDDADRWLSHFGPGTGGPFVAFIEQLRLARAGVVLLSGREIDSFSFDDHVRSRLLPATALRLGDPGEGDMAALIRLMSRQRGISLSERKIAFLVRRLQRSIAAIAEYMERVEHLADVLSEPVHFPILGDAI